MSKGNLILISNKLKNERNKALTQWTGTTKISLLILNTVAIIDSPHHAK